MRIGNIGKLIEIIGRFPGFGERSAQRLVVHLLKKKNTTMRSFIDLLNAVYENSVKCNICNNIDVTPLCSICSSVKRDKSILCVVADISDLWAIERAGFYNGVYHVIGGKLSAIDGIGPENLDMDGLKKRLEQQNDIKEIIIAMSTDMDGKTTTFYIQDQLKNFNIKISVIAHGMPIGSEFDYLDNNTIIAAFTDRR